MLLRRVLKKKSHDELIAGCLVRGPSWHSQAAQLALQRILTADRELLKPFACLGECSHPHIHLL